MAKLGWVSLHRQIQEHWLWKKSKVKSELEAWLDLIMEVNHSREKVSIKGTIIICERTESIKSLDTWAFRWGWNKSRVRRFLKLLQKDSMIELKPCTITTHLKVLNYDTYNGLRNTVETQLKRKRNGVETELTPNNNDNNEKNGNKGLHLFKNSEFLDIEKFKIKFYSNPNYQKYDYTYYYEAVKNWSDSKGAMKKDWIATARNFALNDKEPKLKKENVIQLQGR